MGDDTPRPVLAGQKALVVGVANDDSIAYGCAKAFRAAGADLAITWLNERARPYVEPLARELAASITGPLDVAIPGQLEAMFDQIAQNGAGWTFSFTQSPSRPRAIFRADSELFRGRVCEGDGYFVPFLHPYGEAGGPTDDRRRNDVCHELLRREQGRRKLQCDGSGKGRVRGGMPLSGVRTGSQGIRVHAMSPGPLKTRAASGLKDFELLLNEASQKAPLGELIDIMDVGYACAYLATPFARRITGGTVYVDGGVNLIA